MVSGVTGWREPPGSCVDPMRFRVFFGRGASQTATFGRDTVLLLLSSAILAFGLYNVHAYADITEGGVLGLTLLLEHWFQISPAISGLVLNLICYGLGWLHFGVRFIWYSLISGAGFSVFYFIFEQFPPVWPSLSSMPLLAALVGAVFVGVGAGLSVCLGCASGGDDALALVLHKITGLPIQWIYLMTDGVVLLLSATYLPLGKLFYSLLTVTISGQIIGLIQRYTLKQTRQADA